MTKDILQRIKDDGVEFIQLQFTDYFGAIKSVVIPVMHVKTALEKGVWFDGSSIEGFARIHESDMYLMPDPDTYAVLPWESQEHKVARFICDIYTPEGKPFEGDPRYVLKKVLSEAAEMGWSFNTGPELEFFLFKINNGSEKTKPVLHDTGSYFDFSSKDLATDVRRDIILALQSMGMEVEMSHHEVAPGQHEIDFKYGDALKTADNAITFKQAVKSIAAKYDLYASFMPKPVFGQNGSGMHVHQSIFDIKTGINIFYDAKDKYKLSALAKQFVAGQLAHVRGFCAITSPLVNSYKRLVPGYEAPVYICWAQINRSALIRIPRFSPGREQATRAELRCPDPSANPYLAFAVMLKAGLDGIKKKMMPPEPVEENVYHLTDEQLKAKNIGVLPSSLAEAMEEMEKDPIVRETLGSSMYEKYLAAKKSEWSEYQIQVSQWELERYFENV